MPQTITLTLTGAEPTSTGWLAKNNITTDDMLNADMLNSLANDDRTWGGDVNGGGHKLSNVTLQGSGGFEALLSPIKITQGADGQSLSEYDQGVIPGNLARWTAGKDNAAESTGNAGSNFAIKRYNDAGAVIDSPFTIRRSDGLITLGKQAWGGPVDGGGQTLTNVLIPGKLTDPTTTKGDLITRDAGAVARLGVGGNGQVLMADSAAATGLKWGAQTGVTPTFRVNGVDAGTRNILNLIAGTNVGLTGADTGSVVNITIDAAGGSSGSQTPWAQDINGNGKQLQGAGNIGIGTSVMPLSTGVAGRSYLTIKGSTDLGVLELATALADADNTGVGQIAFTDSLNSQTDKRLAAITVVRSGATANNRGSYMQFLTRADNGTSWAERMRITPQGYVAIGNTGLPPDSASLGARLILGATGAADIPQLTLANTNNTVSGLSASINFANYANVGAEKRIAAINSGIENNINTGWLGFYTWNAGVAGERMRITGAGNVGINAAVAGPACILDVGGFMRVFDGAAAPATGVGLEIGYSAANNWGRILAFDRSGGVAKDIRLGVNNGLQLDLAAGGYVGVGGVPTTRLHVTGTGTVESTFTPSTQAGISLCVQDAAGGAGNGGAVLLGGGATYGCAAVRFLYSNSAGFGQGDLAFYLRAVATTEAMPEVMRLTALGRVGIAQNPTVRLDVMGTAGGPPAISGVVQGGAALRLRNSTGTNVLDAGHYNSSPFGVWLQGVNSNDLSANFPLYLNPNGGGVVLGLSGGAGASSIPDAGIGVLQVTVFCSGPSLYFRWKEAGGTVRQGVVAGA